MFILGLVFSVIINSLLLGKASSNYLVRSAQAKFFPQDADPPEETLELWMGKRVLSLADIASEIRSCDGLMSKSAPMLQTSGIIEALGCMQHRATCRKKRTGVESNNDNQLRKCLELKCNLKCVSQTNDIQDCLKGCMETGDAHNLAMDNDIKNDMDGKEKGKRQQAWKRTMIESVDSRGPYSKSSANEYVIPETIQSAEEASREDHIQSPDHLRSLLRRSDIQLNKRYRLGLYDCISSYCGSLHGEDRKSCIINYCHRSSTLKM